MISNHYLNIINTVNSRSRSIVQSLLPYHLSSKFRFTAFASFVLTRSFRLTLVPFCVIIYHLITDIDWIFSVNIKFIVFVS